MSYLPATLRGVIIAPTVQKFLSGSGTYTTPANCLYIKVKMVGGGGGGSGGGQVSTMGSGGAGGTTTFGSSLLTATGGGGGSANSTGGSGGSVTVNAPAISVVSLAGGIGGGGTLGTSQPEPGAMGASTPFGGAGSCVSYGGGASAAIPNSGSGGGGGSGGGTSPFPGGGGGAAGYIEAIIQNPASSYAYSIGTAGSGGNTGTSGTAGAAGGSGYIEVEEFYAVSVTSSVSVTGTTLLPTFQKFLSGSGTYTLPFPAPSYIRVRAIGGGGAGEGGNGAAGGTGGTTTFGTSLITCTGGAGGSGSPNDTGGAGGSATVSAPAITLAALSGAIGGTQGAWLNGSPTVYGGGGSGASTPFGGGAGGGNNQGGSNAAANTGAGGGGGGNNLGTSSFAGNGGGAGAYAEAVITNPSASYAYSIGAGGVGTTGLNTGGNGGSGLIIVEEYYNQATVGTSTPAKNILLNSNFDFWQRGTSTTVSNGNSGYQADRWYAKNSLGTNGVLTFSQTSGVSSGSKYGASVQITTAPTAGQTNGTELYQTIENMDSLAFYNTSASMSARLKALGNVTQVGLQFYYNTSESKVNTAVGSEQLVTVNSSTFTLGSLLSQSIGTAMTTSGVVGVRIRITAVSSGNTYDLNNGFVVEQVMMNPGSTVGSFTRAGQSTGDELILCQRFYEKSYELAINPGTAGSTSQLQMYFHGGDTTEQFQNVYYAAMKRVAPTLTYYSPATGASGKIRATGNERNAVPQFSGQRGHTWGGDTSALSANYAQGHYTADAEI